ncbi:MAG: type 4a pilus biogenesis protein PilO [Tepidisphaerales bacterium]
MKIGMFLFVTLMIGLLGCGYYFVFKPATDKRLARQAEMETKRKDLTDLRTATVGISDLERKIDEVQKAIKFFESKLPQEKEIDTVLREVWKMAERNNLTTKTIKTLKSERLAGYSEQPVQIGLMGDFRGFYAFLLELEKLSRITRITQMKLEKISNQEGQMTANMTLSIYFESDGASRTAVAVP